MILIANAIAIRSKGNQNEGIKTGAVPDSKSPADDDLFVLAARIAARQSQLSDSFGKVLAAVVHDNVPDSMLQSCDVYLYQTLLSNVRKYGISEWASLRPRSAKGAERNRYEELLHSHRCATRLEAVCVESALNEMIRRDIKVLQIGSLEPTGEEIEFARLLLGDSVELTNVDLEEFAHYVEMLCDDWKQMTPLAFLKANCRKALWDVEYAAWRLGQGILVPVIDETITESFKLRLYEKRLMRGQVYRKAISLAEAMKYKG